MMHKTLEIASFAGLLLSLSLWAVSFWSVGYGRCIGSAKPGRVVDVLAMEGVLFFNYTAGPDALGWRQLQPFAFKTTWTWPAVLKQGENWRVLVPLWAPTAIFAPWFGSTLMSTRARLRKKRGLCVKCGYDLRGSADRCPECWTAFDVAL